MHALLVFASESLRVVSTFHNHHHRVAKIGAAAKFANMWCGMFSKVRQSPCALLADQCERSPLFL
jgi:hypothetical protein